MIRSRGDTKVTDDRRRVDCVYLKGDQVQALQDLEPDSTEFRLAVSDLTLEMLIRNEAVAEPKGSVSKTSKVRPRVARRPRLGGMSIGLDGPGDAGARRHRQTAAWPIKH